MSIATERVRKLYDQSAARYDRKITVPERLLFGSGRQWAAGQAAGRTLEVAAGTGRNLPYYGDAVSLTAVDLSGQMLNLAQQRAAVSRATSSSVSPTRRRCRSTRRSSTPSWRRSRCAASRTTAPPWPRWPGCSSRAAGSCCWTTSAARSRRSAQCNARWNRFLRLEADHLLREPERRVAEAGLRIEQCERSRLGLVLRLAARKPRLDAYLSL